MKFILDLNEEIIVKYARYIGYEENELWNLNENESFIDTITDIIEFTCDGAVF